MFHLATEVDFMVHDLGVVHQDVLRVAVADNELLGAGEYTNNLCVAVNYSVFVHESYIL